VQPAHPSRTGRAAAAEIESPPTVPALLHAAERRDLRAHARDAAARRRDRHAERAQATPQSAQATYQSRAAARDREHAARDRVHAMADRRMLLRQLAFAETDTLTGVHTRAAGLRDLEHELDRCRRTDGLLVVAYLDVVGLKAVNDSHGHAAGDELLKRVVGHIQAHLRSYDLVVRLGGDEFLCAMPDMTLADARQRFAAISTAIACDRDRRSIRTGFAELLSQDTAPELIARADRQLLDNHDGGGRRPALALAPVPRDSDPHTDPATLSFAVAGGPRAPVRARAALAALNDDLPDEQLATLHLLITELVTNSVVHGDVGATQRIAVQIAVHPNTVHGQVTDPGPGFAPAATPTARDIGGLGLVIVDRATDRWGTSHDGRRVWFELTRGR
jgi:diguanylate cyclase (GGDEF)-like protein